MPSVATNFAKTSAPISSENQATTPLLSLSAMSRITHNRRGEVKVGKPPTTCAQYNSPSLGPRRTRAGSGDGAGTLPWPWQIEAVSLPEPAALAVSLPADRLQAITAREELPVRYR